MRTKSKSPTIKQLNRKSLSRQHRRITDADPLPSAPIQEVFEIPRRAQAVDVVVRDYATYSAYEDPISD